jgi:hypothetical protein
VRSPLRRHGSDRLRSAASRSVSVSHANLSPPTQTEAPQVVGRQSSCEHRKTCRTSTGLQALRPLHASLAGYPPQRCCCIPGSKIVRKLQFCTPAHRHLTFWTAQCLLIGNTQDGVTTDAGTRSSQVLEGNRGVPWLRSSDCSEMGENSRPANTSSLRRRLPDRCCLRG